jgi:hypothetical protein
MKILTVDDQKRVRIPDAKPRQAFAYERDPGGRVTLTPVHSIKSNRARLVKANGRLLLETEHPVTLEDTKRALEQFP